MSDIETAPYAPSYNEPQNDGMADGRTYFVEPEPGRRLACLETGDPDGETTVLLSHGSPGCRLPSFPGQDEWCRKQGIRLISYDRPSYGLSDAKPGRRIADCVTDMRAIVGKLGIERFIVAGRSGGGPYALACAAEMPEYVEQVLIMAGGALDFDGFTSTEGVAAANARPFEVLLADHARLARAIRLRPEAVLENLEGGLRDADRRALDNPALRRLIVASHAEAFREQGPAGWDDDVRALRQAPGFNPADIRAPVHVWHGSDDSFVPVRGIYTWLRLLTNAPVRVTLAPGQAHFSAFAAFPRVLARVLSSTSMHEASGQVIH